MGYMPDETPAKQYVLAIVLPCISTFFVGLRFYVRRKTRNDLLWDDWLVMIGLFFTYIDAVFMILGTALGNQGRHMEFSPEGYPIVTDEYIWFLKMLWAGQLSQVFSVGPVKISVILLYRRIFRGPVLNVVTWILIGLVASWVVAFFFANLLECVPIEDSFKAAPGQGGDPNCIDAIPMYFAQVYSDVALDILILLVPIPSVWKLMLPIKQRIMVLGLFLLGIITIIASAAKAIIFNLVGREIPTNPDVSYFLTPIVYWPMIESCLQIVAACLPLLRPLLKPIANVSMLSTLLKDRLGWRKTNTSHVYLRSGSRDPSRDTSGEDLMKPGFKNNVTADVQLYPIEDLQQSPRLQKDKIHVAREYSVEPSHAA